MFILWNYYNLLFIDSPGRDDGYLWFPTSTAVTPEHTVMISDGGNKRISEFSLDDGRFIRQVLTWKDGIYRPECISLQGNLLWLSGINNIQCYKLYTR